MRSRKATAEQKQALMRDLWKSMRDGDLRPGDTLPPLRELGARYQLSAATVLVQLQPMFDAGVLESARPVGIRVAHAVSADEKCFVLLVAAPGTRGAGSPHTPTLRYGFEERITELGGSSLAMQVDDMAHQEAKGALPGISGIFAWALGEESDQHWVLNHDLPQVWSYYFRKDNMQLDRPVDHVHFDDVDGGRQATLHLLRHGHHSIAFLGFHRKGQATAFDLWSSERELGWQTALAKIDTDPESLAFHPDTDVFTLGGQIPTAIHVARKMLLERHRFTAVVGADDRAIMGLVEVWREAKIPPEEWPALVGFEGLTEATNYVLTSVRPPYIEIGRAAADLLWERASGKLIAPSQTRIVPMTLVSRLGSHKAWATNGGNAIITAT